ISAENSADLYLKVPSQQSRSFEVVKSILEIYNYGKSNVFVYFEDTKKLCKALDTHAQITHVMLTRLKEILGEENVKIKEVKQ
ncbi:MAG: hypothetical protein J6K12_01590, partial [Clostridia bacterium]|nr:hypothetical protein [Clostridia bacterium]